MPPNPASATIIPREAARSAWNDLNGGQSCQIPSDEISFHPHSFGDLDGRLFTWRGGIYRAISAAGVPLIRRLLDAGVIERLVAKKLLIGTKEIPGTLPGYELLLQHHRVPFASYPNEWCPEMFKAAVLVELDLLLALDEEGLTLKDAHPWNILFDGPSPVQVDLTSIIPTPARESWGSNGEFLRYCLYPLLVMYHGHERIARLLLCEDEGVSADDLAVFIGRSAARAVAGRRFKATLRRTLPRWIQTFIGHLSNSGKFDKPRNGCLRRKLLALREKVESLSFTAKKRDSWTAGDDLTEQIEELLRKFTPRTVLEIGCGGRDICRLAATMGSDVVAFDRDSTCLSSIYEMAKAENLSILPLVMDVTKPTPPRGISSHWQIAATERFHCDMVLALNLHIDFRGTHLRTEQIVEGISAFAKNLLIIGFSSENGFNGDFSAKLRQCLREQFREVVESNSFKRTLLICSR